MITGPVHLLPEVKYQCNVIVYRKLDMRNYSIAGKRGQWPAPEYTLLSYLILSYVNMNCHNYTRQRRQAMRQVRNCKLLGDGLVYQRSVSQSAVISRTVKCLAAKRPAVKCRAPLPMRWLCCAISVIIYALRMSLNIFARKQSRRRRQE